MNDVAAVNIDSKLVACHTWLLNVTEMAKVHQQSYNPEGEVNAIQLQQPDCGFDASRFPRNGCACCSLGDEPVPQ